MNVGTVKVWDPRQKNDPVATMEPQENETKRDCWTVAFGEFFSCKFVIIFIINIILILVVSAIHDIFNSGEFPVTCTFL